MLLLGEYLEDLLETISMVTLIFTVDQDVIEIDHHEITKKGLEDLIH